MLTDAELLADRLRRDSEDEALMNAYADCIREMGDEKRADAVIAYRNHQRLLTIHLRLGWGGDEFDHHRWEADRLWFVAGLRDIRVGDPLSYDDFGRVFPVSSYWQRRVGYAVTKAKTGGTVIVRGVQNVYAPGSNLPEPEWELEVSRL